MPTVLTRILPEVRLPEAAFTARHRALHLVLWLHVPLLAAVALVAGGHVHGDRTAGDVAVWSSIGLTALAAVAGGALRGRRARSVAVSVGLLMAAVSLVHAGGGLTDLHFHFFVVLALIGLYQDWLPFLVAVVLVAAHHLVMGLAMPGMVFSDPRAQTAPLAWALLHAVFVLAMCAALVTSWRFAAAAQAAAAAERERTTAEGESALRAAAAEATESARREQAAAGDAAAQLAHSTELAARLEQVVGSVAERSVALAGEAGEAMAQLEDRLGEASSVVGTATGQTGAALDEAARAQARIDGLVGSIAQITEVTSLIRAVAKQTDLLALNATIEATRAGAAGRGFEVVADEVKTLAGQTATATGRIETTLAEVTAGATAVAESMTALSARLAEVARMQDQVAASIAEQAGLAVRTRTSVVSAAGQVGASLAEVRG